MKSKPCSTILHHIGKADSDRTVFHALHDIHFEQEIILHVVIRIEQKSACILGASSCTIPKNDLDLRKILSKLLSQ